MRNGSPAFNVKSRQETERQQCRIPNDCIRLRFEDRVVAKKGTSVWQWLLLDYVERPLPFQTISLFKPRQNYVTPA